MYDFDHYYISVLLRRFHIGYRSRYHIGFSKKEPFNFTVFRGLLVTTVNSLYFRFV